MSLEISFFGTKRPLLYNVGSNLTGRGIFVSMDMLFLRSLKFKYSEKEGHKILRNLHLYLFYVVTVKSKMEISQNFVAFLEYMNFKDM